MNKLRKVVVLGTLVVVVVALSGWLWAAEAEKVNINTASVEQLAKLNRIGPKYAERIVEFREKNGRFQTVEDIMKVPGIGPKTLEANKDRLVVE